MMDTVGFIILITVMLLFAIWDTGLPDTIKCLKLLAEAGRLSAKLCYLAPGAFIEWIARNRKPDIVQMARELGLDKPITGKSIVEQGKFSMQEMADAMYMLAAARQPFGSYVEPYTSPPQSYTPLLEDDPYKEEQGASIPAPQVDPLLMAKY